MCYFYMTSHGEQNHFEIENAPLDLGQVDPKWLRETLDKAGIRWRVIVISACYSRVLFRRYSHLILLSITASTCG